MTLFQEQLDYSLSTKQLEEDKKKKEERLQLLFVVMRMVPRKSFVDYREVC